MSNDDRKDLPPINSANFLEKLREAVQTYMGTRGDKLDRGLTVRDMANAGLAKINPRYMASSGRVPPLDGAGSAITDAYEPDLTPPPTPSGFTVSAAISNIFIEHAAPTYTQGHGHAKTVVYGATWISGALPVFANAVPITEFSGTVFAHPSNPATTWHLWIKWMSVDGVESTVPAGGTNGLVATTGQDVSLLLDALSGEITAGQLHSALGSRINLIDAAGTGLVTGLAAVKVESSASASSVTGLLAQYTVKLDVGGKVSGYGLASSAASSEFAIRADRFYIAPPETGGGTATQIIPFAVQATATTINGVSVPAGIYVNDAYIKNGTITNAKIANLAVNDAKIANLSVSKLTAGAINTGDITSTGTAVVGGVAVPSWTINASTGLATFNNVVARGTVYASAGQIGGNTIDSTGMQSPSFSTTSGWRLDSNGVLNAKNVQLTGQITGGAFTGYVWPGYGAGGGFYLGPNGLLLGSANDGKYFKVTSSGDVYAPGFNITSGSAVFSGQVSGATIATNSGKFSVSSGGILNAIEADIQRRVVLQTGLYTPTIGGSATIAVGASGSWGGPGAANTISTFSVDPNLIATDVYDGYLVDTGYCQKYEVSLHAEGLAYYSGGSGNYEISGTAETMVCRRYSAGGTSTVNDTQVFIKITSISVKAIDPYLSTLTIPSLRWKLHRV